MLEAMQSLEGCIIMLTWWNAHLIIVNTLISFIEIPPKIAHLGTCGFYKKVNV